MSNSIYIFGMGKNGREILEILNRLGLEVKAFIDNDESKQGIKLESGGTLTECISVEEAVAGGINSIILVSPGRSAGIVRQLRSKGFKHVVRANGLKYLIPSLFEEEDYIHAAPFNHYESPYPDIVEIHKKENELFDRDIEVRDIDLNLERQFELIGQMDRIQPPDWCEEEKDSLVNRYYYHNNWFGKGSVDALYYMIRLIKPENIVEAGSGFSTAAMLDINEKYFNNDIKITCIEPNAARLRSLLRPTDNLEINECGLQDMPLEFFQRLGENDILFIDSSHVSRFGSDVNYLFFEILPRLKKGVYVHFHDMFYPFIYPKKWVYEGRAYNEMYMVRAFLMNNHDYLIQLFGDMLQQKCENRIPDRLKGCGAGSLWIRKER